MQQQFRPIEIEVFDGSQTREDVDNVAVEEPLEIRIRYGASKSRKTRSFAVTMRTPGNDFELAAGFLVSEGIVRKPGEIQSVSFQPPFLANSTKSNLVEVELDSAIEFETTKLQRHFYLTSSCGICGKASLDIIRADGVVPFALSRQDEDSREEDSFQVPSTLIQRIGDQLRSRQAVFQVTGGLHGAALVSETGEFIAVREDVGRHNAVDKLIGGQFLQHEFPIERRFLVLSGRASFELMQKALLARISTVVAIGAPSSLAVELAREFGMTLVGFASAERFNIYSGAERIRYSAT